MPLYKGYDDFIFSKSFKIYFYSLKKNVPVTQVIFCKRLSQNIRSTS